MLLADPDRRELEMNLAVADAINLEPGAEIRFFLNIDPARPVMARLERAGYRAAQTAEGIMAYRLRAGFENDDARLRIGLRGTRAHLRGTHGARPLSAAPSTGMGAAMAGLVIGPPVGAIALSHNDPNGGGGASATRKLPPLRDELVLHPGPSNGDGAPSWTLEDPARGRYFRLGWAEIEMLARWDRDDPAAIAAAITQETTLTVDAAEVEAFVRFLASANLVRVEGPRALGQLHEQAQAARMNPVAFLLKNYLFIRIPLVRPDPFLDRTIGLAAPFFSPVFWIVTLIAGLAGMLLVLRQWDGFVTTFVHLFSWQGLAAIGIGLIFAKIAHELAHAYAAKHEGVAVPTMGIALMVLYPVLYTDTTAAWRLTDRARRLRIGYAGMATELAIAAWMTLAWSFMPDGPVRSAAFILATTTWIMTLAVNLNPFMRFDGYFLFSDALDMPNPPGSRLPAGALAVARGPVRLRRKPTRAFPERAGTASDHLCRLHLDLPFCPVSRHRPDRLSFLLQGARYHADDRGAGLVHRSPDF